MLIDTLSKPQPDFTVSRQKKLNGLIERKVFKLVKAIDIPANI